MADELPEHFQLIGIALDATEEEFFATIAEESVDLAFLHAPYGLGKIKRGQGLQRESDADHFRAGPPRTNCRKAP